MDRFPLQAARRALWSLGKQALTAKERRMLIDFLNGRLPTAEQVNATRPHIDPYCPYGCRVLDTPHHRLWCCPHGKHVREEAFP